MQFEKEKLNLQFFGGEGAGAASGGGDGAGDGASTGVTSADAGQSNDSTGNTLEGLGVPKDKVERFKQSKARRGVQAPEAKEDAPAVVEEPPAEEPTPAARDFDSEFKSILDQPEFNQRIQDIVSKRVGKMRGFVDDLAPALAMLGDKYGVDASDVSKLDAKALNEAIVKDKSFYEKVADEMGVDTETAMSITQKTRDAERVRKQAEDILQQQAFNQHMDGLKRQAAALKQVFPEFDLERELQDERFRRMTSPSGGLTVEDAYYATHHREISQAQATINAQRAAQALSNSIQSGRNVPAQNGTTGKTSAPVVNKLYSQMNREERAAYKQRLINHR